MADFFSDLTPVAPYTTTLQPGDEAAFQGWVKAKKVPFQDAPKSDYDMRGFWKGRPDLAASWQPGQHFPDTWKTPYHKTFSVESKYATGEDRAKAGSWKGETFIPPSSAGGDFFSDLKPVAKKATVAAGPPEPPNESRLAGPPIPLMPGTEWLARARGLQPPYDSSRWTEGSPEPPNPKGSLIERMMAERLPPSSEEQYQKETATANILTAPSEYVGQKTEQYLAPKIGAEPARLAGAATGGALFPMPGVGTAGRIAYGVGTTASADLAGMFTDNPLIKLGASFGIPILAGRLYEHAYASEPFERAQGSAPKVGPEASAAHQEAQKAGPTTWAEPIELSEKQAVTGGTSDTDIPQQVQRFEEPGRMPRHDKPQGLYTSPAGIESPHADLGGKRTVLSTNPSARVLRLDASELVTTDRGTVGQPAGIAALRQLAPQEFADLSKLKKADLQAALTQRVSGVEWGQFTDAHDMLDALGSVRARQAGYDAIWATDQDPTFNEYVGLNATAFAGPKGPLGTSSTSRVAELGPNQLEGKSHRHAAHDLTDASGNPIGYMDLTLDRDAKTVHVKMIKTDDPTQHWGLTKVVRQIKEQYPWAEKVEGKRISGAHQGQVDVAFRPPTKAEGEQMAAQAMAPDTTLYQIPAKDIKVDAERMQFKTNVNKQGVGKDLGDAQWNPGLANVSTLYHVPEGDNPATREGMEPGDYALNGHHRRDLAMRNGENTKVPSQFVDAGNDPRIDAIKKADGSPMRGVSPSEARAFGALQNIADQRGTAFDMAKFLRESGTPPEGLKALGISMTEAKTQDATGLAKLSPYLWKELTTGKLREATGVVIGKELPGDEETQHAIYKMLTDFEDRTGKKMSADHLEDIIKLGKTSDAVTGGEQGGLFGADFMKSSTLPQQAQILGEVRTELNRQARMMATAARGKESLETVGETQIDRPELQAKSAVARRLAEFLPKFAYQAGSETNGVIKRLAYDLAEKPRAANETYARARNEVGAAVQADARASGIDLAALPDESVPPQTSLFGEGGGTELSGGIVPVQAAQKVQSLTRWAGQKINQSKAVTLYKAALAPETLGPDAHRAAAIKMEQAAELRARIGSPALLSRPMRNWFDTLPPDQRWNIYSQMQRGNFDVLPDQFKPLATALRDAFDTSHAEIEKVKGGIVPYRQNYLGQLWKNSPDEVDQAFKKIEQASGKSLSARAGFLKARKYDTVEEGIKAGLTPKYDNPVDMSLAALQNQWRYITGQRTFQGLKDAGLTRFIKEGERLPPKYAWIDDRIANVRQFAPKEGGFIQRGRYAATEDAARIINNYTAPGIGPNILSRVNAASNFVRTLGVFHVLLETNTMMDLQGGGALSEAMGALAHGDLPAAGSAAKRLGRAWSLSETVNTVRLGRKVQKLVESGAFTDPQVQRVIKAGGSFQFGDTVAAQTMAEAFSEKFGVAGRMARGLAEGVMRHFVSPAKNGALLKLSELEIGKAIERNGGEALTAVQERDVLQGVRRHLDDSMGQIARDNLHYKNSLKDVMQMIVSFPGWNIGTVRLFSGVGRGAAQFAAGAEMDMQARLAVRFAAGKALRVGLTGALINRLVTGQWPKSIYELYTLPTGQKDRNGNDIRVVTPEYLIKDAISIAGHYRHQNPNDPLAIPKALAETAAGKLSPALVAGYEIWNNADFYGRPIYYPDVEGLPKDAARIIEHIFEQGGVPFAARNVGEAARQQGTSIPEELAQGKVGAVAGQAAVGVLGLQPTPKAIRQTPMQNFVDKAKQATMPPQGASDPKQIEKWNQVNKFEDDARKYRAKAGPKPDPRPLLKAGVSPQEMQHYWKLSGMTPVEAGLHRISLPQVAKAWQIAKDAGDDRDVKVARRVMIQRLKGGGWERMQPEQKRELAPILRTLIKKDDEKPAAPAAAPMA